jgi:hypothetical protein
MGLEFVSAPPVLRRIVADYIALLPAAQTTATLP